MLEDVINVYHNSQVVHSHDYRRPDEYEDKRVLVVGIGNSGGDVAVELSRKAAQVRRSSPVLSVTLSKVNTSCPNVNVGS